MVIFTIVNVYSFTLLANNDNDSDILLFYLLSGENCVYFYAISDNLKKSVKAFFNASHYALSIVIVCIAQKIVCFRAVL